MTRLTEFRPVPGFEGVYEVNGMGMVWSIPRISHREKSGPRPCGGAFLKPRTAKHGYKVVTLRGGASGHRRTRFVHQLVLEAFAGARPEGAITRHLNGDPADNRLSNLRYGTQAENAADTVKHGRHPQSRKEACPMGHLLVDGNIDPLFTQGRRCLTCKRDHASRQKFTRAVKRQAAYTMQAALACAKEGAVKAA